MSYWLNAKRSNSKIKIDGGINMNQTNKKNISEMSEEEKEIETIKPRILELKLSNADVERIYKKAGEVGLTVADLLENFIGDLVCGTYSNGSDERMYAQQWFDRCGFSMFQDKTFLKYLIEWNELENVVDNYNRMKEEKIRLMHYEGKEELDDYDKEEIKWTKMEIKDYQESLTYEFEEYKKWAKDEKAGTWEEEIGKVLEWKKTKDQMINIGSRDNNHYFLHEEKERGSEKFEGKVPEIKKKTKIR